MVKRKNIRNEKTNLKIKNKKNVWVSKLNIWIRRKGKVEEKRKMIYEKINLRVGNNKKDKESWLIEYLDTWERKVKENKIKKEKNWYKKKVK